LRSLKSMRLRDRLVEKMANDEEKMEEVRIIANKMLKLSYVETRKNKT